MVCYYCRVDQVVNQFSRVHSIHIVAQISFTEELYTVTEGQNVEVCIEVTDGESHVSLDSSFGSENFSISTISDSGTQNYFDLLSVSLSYTLLHEYGINFSNSHLLSTGLQVQKPTCQPAYIHFYVVCSRLRAVLRDKSCIKCGHAVSLASYHHASM